MLPFKGPVNDKNRLNVDYDNPTAFGSQVYADLWRIFWLYWLFKDFKGYERITRFPCFFKPAQQEGFVLTA